jgi:hypothetical protein
LFILGGMLLRAIFAAGLFAGLSSALAQAPPPVPALPDTQRQTTYNITSSTCACAVGFQLYGDSTDVDNWIFVLFNSVKVLSTDPTFGWSLSSPTGSLASIARPITDAVLTFNNAQTGQVIILGAERPRRLTTFNENQGVTARQLNQVINTLFAELRELWDRGTATLNGPNLWLGTQTFAGGLVFNGGLTVGIRTSTGPTYNVGTTDYFLCLDATVNAITVNLPASPGTGRTVLVKDCTGQSAAHNITVVPAAGNIDGNPSTVMATPYQAIGLTYTGAQWSLN